MLLPSKVATMYGKENANTPTATPTIPQIRELFPSSGLLFKKWTPEIINMIMANPINSGQMKLLITVSKAPVTLSSVKSVLGVAKATIGKASKVAEENKATNFLFIDI